MVRVKFMFMFSLQVVDGSGIMTYFTPQLKVIIMAKGKYITMRVDEKIHEHLKKMAARDHRPLSNLLAMVLVKMVEKDKERAVR